jgi:hypothetical protein
MEVRLTASPNVTCHERETRQEGLRFARSMRIIDACGGSNVGVIVRRVHTPFRNDRG